MTWYIAPRYSERNCRGISSTCQIDLVLLRTMKNEPCYGLTPFSQTARRVANSSRFTWKRAARLNKLAIRMLCLAVGVWVASNFVRNYSCR